MKKTIAGVISVAVLATIISLTRVQTYVINPNVTQDNIQSTICVSGWTSTIRPTVAYTNKLKNEQLKDVSFVSKDSSAYEEDHRISLELGGAPSDPNNLYPQPYTNVINGINLGAREKDSVETWLHSQVCSSKITLKDAQDKIINHWAEIYLQIKGYQIEPSKTDE